MVARDAALVARDEALARLEAISHSNQQLQAAHADLVSTRGAALVMRRAALDSASRPYAGLLPRVMALTALLAIVAVLLLVARII